jgi:hypothetical protein
MRARAYPRRGDSLKYLQTLTGVRRASAVMEQGMCINVTELNEVLTVAKECAGIARPAEARRAPGPFSDGVYLERVDSLSHIPTACRMFIRHDAAEAMHYKQYIRK